MATVGSLSGLARLPLGQKIAVRGKRLTFFYVKTPAGWTQQATFHPLAAHGPLGVLGAVAPATDPNVWTDAEMLDCIQRVSTRATPIAELCR